MIVYAVIVPIVIALNEMLKRTGILAAKIIPLSNVLLGICFFIAYAGADGGRSIAAGFFIGVFTTGIYSSVKNILHWLKNIPQYRTGSKKYAKVKGRKDNQFPI